MEAAAERARVRGGRGVALAALERAAELSVDRESRALRLSRAGELAYELGHPTDATRLLRAAQQHGLPAQEHALASFRIELLEPTWSGAAMIRSFAGIAQELADAGHDDQALETLETVSLRANWDHLDAGPAARRRSRSPSGSAARRTNPRGWPRWRSSTRWVRGRRSYDAWGGWLRSTWPTPKASSASGWRAAAVWADNLALPFLRAASAGFRADGRLALLAETLVAGAWAEVETGAVRVAFSPAAEGVQLAEETRQVRYVAAGQLAQAVAAVEMGADESVERLIGTAEGMLLPMGANPLLSLVAWHAAGTALAHERFSEAYTQLLRIFDPNDAAYQQFVGGCSARRPGRRGSSGRRRPRGRRRGPARVGGGGDGDGAPQLDVQLRYASAILADDGNAEPLYESAMGAGAEGWPFYAARAQLAYGRWLRRQHRMTDSRAPLREAAQSFDALGLRRYAERARRELRAAGEVPRRRAPEAWAQLTPQELQIAQLAAEGLSNREIGERLYLSHRTVGSHLYRLFPKLGVTARSAAAPTRSARPRLTEPRCSHLTQATGTIRGLASSVVHGFDRKEASE